MAITPQSYPFSGGAFMGGGGTEVKRDDIHSLVLTKNGRTIGNYNPLTGDTTIDIPKDAVMLYFDPYGSAKMGSERYSEMTSAIDDGQGVILKSVAGRSTRYWQLASDGAGGYNFVSIGSDTIYIANIAPNADSSGDHRISVSTFDFDVEPFHEEGAFDVLTSAANTKLDLFSVDVPDDGVYIVSLLCRIKPTALGETKSEVVFSIEGPDGTGLPNTTRSNLIDNSDNFDQPFEITVILELKAGTNTVKALFTGAYQIFGDRWSVTSIRVGGSEQPEPPVVEDEIFYGTEETSFEDWLAAFDSGKTLFLKKVFSDEEHYRTRVYRMVDYDNGRDHKQFRFVCVEGTIEYSGTLTEAYLPDWYFWQEDLAIDPTVEGSVEKLLEDLDTKLNTSMDMGDIVDCYDMAANSNGINGNLLGFAFTVPINSPIRLSDTKIVVYAKQNYSTKVIIGLYEYNFDGNNGAGQTLWVCDTGPVSIVAGRNEFPVTHLRSTDRELKSDRVYYASIYFPSGKSLGCYLAGKPGYDNTVNARPQFTLGADNISLDINDLNATLEDTGFWASGYNERPSIPRFLMQIRNKENGGQPQSGPFDNLASFTLQNRTLSEMGFTNQPLNNGIVFKKVVPREAVTVKKWKWIDDQSNGEWGHGWCVCDGTMVQLVNSSSDVSITNTANGDGTYTHEATHNSGIQLQAENVYWFPVQGNTSNQLSATLGGYSGNKQDNLRCCQSGYNIQWGPSQDLNTSNAYLYLEDNNGNGWTI